MESVMQTQQIQHVMEKLQTLPPNRVDEVEDFIDFLTQRDRDRQLTQAAMSASESTLQAIWDNADDAKYDQL